ncbi:MAG: EF-hand domain-containing protein [Dechloromonas sp.]|nr:EF-hand domain-containing protein [Dechloromonas sp.]
MIDRVGNSSQMFSHLFSRLDTKSQGYLEKSDFASALSNISGSDSSGVDSLFSTLDSDSNGQVTESEFSSVLSQLQQSLMASQSGPQGMGGMPPPPPPPSADDAGFTEEELSSQLSEIGSSDSPRSSMISNIIDNFSAADTDGDGKVSFQEANSFRQSQDSATSTGSDSTTAQAASSEMQVMRQIMQLMHAYGQSSAQGSSSTSSLLSALA